MRAALLIALAGCIDVAPAFTCKLDSQCGSGGVCEASGNCAVSDATCGTGGYRYDASAGSRAGICVLADQVQQVQLTFAGATNRSDSSCAKGSRDVSFEITLPSAQTLAVDTPDAATGLAIYPGACPGTSGTDTYCAAGVCPGAAYNHGATQLDAGTYCIVVEQTEATMTATLRVFTVAAPAILPTRASPVTGISTCGRTNDAPAASCISGAIASSLPFLVLRCPSSNQLVLQAAATPESTFHADLALSLFDPIANAQVAGACDDNTGVDGTETLPSTRVSSPGPYWLYIDNKASAPGQCGKIDLTYSLQ
ncbi:MAG TPA: hypothetical protein VGF94_20400 [Kofleriaceae bacterium]